MNNDEAKFVLRAYRPGGGDAGDPALAAALEQAKKDPALAAWFEREQAHAKVVSSKLRTIVPPPGLRDAILAGAQAGTRGGGRRSGWRRPVWLAMAAAIAVLLGVAAWWRLAPVGGTSFEEFAVNFVDRGFRLEKHSADLSELKAWLAAKRGPLPAALPAQLAALRALGCRTLDFRGREVSLVCFERDGREFHVFVARREAISDTAEAAEPRFRAHGKLVAGAWSDVRNHYVVVSDADLPTLQRVL